MKAVLGLLALVLVVAGAAQLLNQSGTISQGFRVVNDLVANTQKTSGVVWLISFAGLWLVLIVVADTGPGGEELATVLAGIILLTILGTNLSNGNLVSQLNALKPE